jgi:hypothetical protein
MQGFGEIFSSVKRSTKIGVLKIIIGQAQTATVKQFSYFNAVIE